MKVNMIKGFRQVTAHLRSFFFLFEVCFSLWTKHCASTRHTVWGFSHIKGPYAGHILIPQGSTGSNTFFDIKWKPIFFYLQIQNFSFNFFFFLVLEIKKKKKKSEVKGPYADHILIPQGSTGSSIIFDIKWKLIFFWLQIRNFSFKFFVVLKI